MAVLLSAPVAVGSSKPMADIQDQLLRTIGVRHPGVLVLTPAQALEFTAGFSANDPDSAAAQRIARGTYPFPLIKQGRRWGVLVTDLAASLAQLAHAAEPEEPKRGPGRPRKFAGSAP